MVAFNYFMNTIFDVHDKDVVFTPSDIGWIVGHNFITYGPLIRGGTAIMYEGKPVGTPDAGVYWRIIKEHNVKCFFVAPTAVRAIKKEDHEGHHIKLNHSKSL
jgi:propionyl-CoA synthetase